MTSSRSRCGAGGRWPCAALSPPTVHVVPSLPSFKTTPHSQQRVAQAIGGAQSLRARASWRSAIDALDRFFGRSVEAFASDALRHSTSAGGSARGRRLEPGELRPDPKQREKVSKLVQVSPAPVRSATAAALPANSSTWPALPQYSCRRPSRSRRAARIPFSLSPSGWSARLRARLDMPSSTRPSAAAAPTIDSSVKFIDFAIAGLQETEPDRLRIVARQQVGERFEVAERLRHLPAVEVEQSAVHPEVRHRRVRASAVRSARSRSRDAERSDRRRRREYRTGPSGPSKLARHRPALDVPARPSVAPGRTATSARPAWRISTAQNRADRACARPSAMRAPTSNSSTLRLRKLAVARKRLHRGSTRRPCSRRRARSQSARRSSSTNRGSICAVA